MSEEKQLDPTPARIARARRDGNSPRSAELVAAAAFGAAALAACSVTAPIGALARSALLAAARGLPASSEEGGIIALALLPLAFGAAFAALAGIVQSGGLTIVSLGIRASRLDPFEGLRRIASRETPAHALRALLAFFAGVAGIAPAIAQAVVAAARADGLAGVVTAAWGGARRTLFVACAVGLVFAAAEYAIVRGSWLRKLRMSHEELKREVKEHEGDPHARGRRKSRHRELARGSITRVREAAFVVTNPTHVAIALAYRPPEIAVPLVLVRAADAAALRVRELATRWSVPVVEQPLLARALFASASPGSPIPAEHYVAIAEIVVALVRNGVLAS